VVFDSQEISTDKEKAESIINQYCIDSIKEISNDIPDISSTRTVESAKNMIRELVETMNLSSYWKYKLNPQIPLLNELRHIVGMENLSRKLKI
jgi:hypothetical protein